MGRAGAAVARRAVLAGPPVAEPRPDRRAMARRWWSRADRVLSGARPVRQHRPGRRGGAGAERAPAAAAAGRRAQPEGARGRRAAGGHLGRTPPGGRPERDRVLGGGERRAGPAARGLPGASSRVLGQRRGELAQWLPAPPAPAAPRGLYGG